MTLQKLCTDSISPRLNMQVDLSIQHEMRSTVIDLVMATDMKQHFSLISQLQASVCLRLIHRNDCCPVSYAPLTVHQAPLRNARQGHDAERYALKMDRRLEPAIV